MKVSLTSRLFFDLGKMVVLSKGCAQRVLGGWDFVSRENDEMRLGFNFQRSNLKRYLRPAALVDPHASWSVPSARTRR